MEPEEKRAIASSNGLILRQPTNLSEGEAINTGTSLSYIMGLILIPSESQRKETKIHEVTNSKKEVTIQE
jgi:hypothetical protein